MQPTDGCDLSLKNCCHCPLRTPPDTQETSCSPPRSLFVGPPRLTESSWGPHGAVRPAPCLSPMASLTTWVLSEQLSTVPYVKSWLCNQSSQKDTEKGKIHKRQPTLMQQGVSPTTSLANKQTDVLYWNSHWKYLSLFACFMHMLSIHVLNILAVSHMYF